MDHYYTREPSSPHDPGRVTLELGGKTYTFATDAGVFSRERVDFGTALLVSACPPVKGRLLDLGCGCGVLGLGLALHYGLTRPVLTDVNLRALELTRKNALSLGIAADVRESDGFCAMQGEVFDAIVTNPPIRAGKAVYYPWFRQAWDHLHPGGFFACVVRKGQGGPSVKREIAAAFGSCEILDRSDGYWILLGRRQPSGS